MTAVVVAGAVTVEASDCSGGGAVTVVVFDTVSEVTVEVTFFMSTIGEIGTVAVVLTIFEGTVTAEDLSD